MLGFNRYSVSILDSSWNMMIPKARVEHVPRIDELIYLESDDTYYQVKAVVHNINKKQGVFVIVEKYNK
jgi:hypothetical protein